MNENFELIETSFGFDWGPMSVERSASHEKWGVMLTLRSNRETVDIRVTPTGLIRISGPVKRSHT